VVRAEPLGLEGLPPRLPELICAQMIVHLTGRSQFILGREGNRLTPELGSVDSLQLAEKAGRSAIAPGERGLDEAAIRDHAAWWTGRPTRRPTGSLPSIKIALDIIMAPSVPRALTCRTVLCMPYEA